ncbi:MAG: c-type cytochrome [Acidimicrobiia bacterium]
MRLARHHHLTAVLRVAVAATAVVGVAAACGANDAAGPELPAAAAEGRDIARTNGCAACHGRDGEGGPGPAFAGLFGSTVELEDGTTVVADVDYLVESIRDPDAKEVAGYGIVMPTNNLSDAEIESVVAWIQALADSDEETGS